MTALIETIAFLIPVAVLLTLLRLWWGSYRYKRGALPGARGGEIEPFRAVPEMRSAADLPAADLAPPVQLESVDTILKKIEAATADGRKTALSGLYFDLAAAHGRQGNSGERMSALRSAAGNGALHGPPAAHAAARLALGEEAYSAGDLTSACEQWQMARAAFLEGGDQAQHAQVERRMRENGCPTDWVLTDF